MLTVSFAVSNEIIEETRETLEKWYGLRLTLDQVCDILLAYPRVAAEVVGGIDMHAREILIDAIIEDVGMPEGSYWPVNGDDLRTKEEFFWVFCRKCVAAGYGVIWSPHKTER